MKNEIVRLSVILFAITFVAALMLGLVNMSTQELIEQHAVEELDAALRELFPQASEFEEIAVSGELDKRLTGMYHAKSSAGDTLGYCADVSQNGFGGAIKLLVGVAPDNSIVRVKVLDNSTETPGLGTRVSEDEFISQFDGKSGDIAVVKVPPAGKSEVVAVTGATISSDAVAVGVNLALKSLAAVTGNVK